MRNQAAGPRRRTDVRPRGGQLLVALATILAAVACSSPGRVSVVSGPDSTSPGATPPSATSSATEPATAVTPAPASATPSTTRPRTSASISVSKPSLVMLPPVTDLVLTAADDRATFTVRVSSTITLTLDGAQTRWGPITVTPDGLLAARTAPAPPPHGAAAAWGAAHPGTVRLTATGTAYCPPSPQPVACPLFAQAFAVTIVIN